MPTDSIGGYVEVCADYVCDPSGGMIENYIVDGRTMVVVPYMASLVNVDDAVLTPVSGAAPQPPSLPAPQPPVSPAGGPLNTSVPISNPSCDGTGIVVLGSVTTPGQYSEGVQRLLNANPGAAYLRTDQSCPSLRPATADGNPIYAVYKIAGKSESAVCDAVRGAGGIAYGKWLDTTHPPDYVIPC
ncbi:serine/threonine protein kinase [Mycobacterium sp. ITM-2016-00318]|uniref:serine/threonine protein kinase n=1 Tax=Mycobacterium sp. ITM-2016-00318 TaxID=2099693 RepID=UPI001157F38A|nr:serine/threonine protein kinase [Mycobacterium sp. ITM-2016-00318]WNG93683.1 serine/threonine protein kinase [Mycobacterium sp. ITM-2016-00318]